MMEKTKISTVLYKGRLLGLDSHKKKALGNFSRDFKLKANTFVVKMLHMLCYKLSFSTTTKKSVLNKNTVITVSL